MLRDPVTMEQDYRRSARPPLVTLGRLTIAFGIAMTVLAFFLALSGCPLRKARASDALIRIDVSSVASYRAYFERIGAEKIKADQFHKADCIAGGGEYAEQWQSREGVVFSWCANRAPVPPPVAEMLCRFGGLEFVAISMPTTVICAPGVPDAPGRAGREA